MIGRNDGTVVNSHWDTTATGKTSGSGTGAGTFDAQSTGVTTAAMHSQATFSGWDFTNTWFMTSGLNPTLRSGTTILGTGSTSLTLSTAADSANVINNTTLQNLLGAGNVMAVTTGALTAATPATWSTGTTLSLVSGGAMTVNAASGLTGSGSGSGLGLYAAGGALKINSSDLSTVNGRLSVVSPNSGSNDAISLSASTFSVGAGTAYISGNATSGNGVVFSGASSLASTGVGTSSVIGTSRSGRGVFISEGTALTTSGTTLISGFSNTSSGVGFCLAACSGATLTNAAGNLNVNGYSSALNATASGVDLFGETLTNSGSGTFNLSGAGYYSSTGVYISGNTSNLTKNGSGSVLINGTSGNYAGVLLDNNSAIASSGK